MRRTQERPRCAGCFEGDGMSLWLFRQLFLVLFAIQVIVQAVK